MEGVYEGQDLEATCSYFCGDPFTCDSHGGTHSYDEQGEKPEQPWQGEDMFTHGGTRL